MTIAVWCVLIAALLPYAWTSLAKFGRGTHYDNRRPREFLEHLEGWRKRADWAQQNAFEAFPPFAVGVLVAQSAGAAQPSIDRLAVVFIVARVAHCACYLLDRAALRSLVWGIGFASMIGLFVLAARA